MYLLKDNHVSRHAPYKKLLRDNDDNPVGLLPQAFEMREELGEKALSVNWLEYFGGTHNDNIASAIKSFRLSRDGKVGKKSAFGIGNVGILCDECDKLKFTRVRVLYNEKKPPKNNKSHSSIIRLPFNNTDIMQSLSMKVFTMLVPNKDIPEE